MVQNTQALIINTAYKFARKVFFWGRDEFGATALALVSANKRSSLHGVFFSCIWKEIPLYFQTFVMNALAIQGVNLFNLLPVLKFCDICSFGSFSEEKMLPVSWVTNFLQLSLVKIDFYTHTSYYCWDQWFFWCDVSWWITNSLLTMNLIWEMRRLGFLFRPYKI